ncbi:MAG: hypothetical protein HY314_10490 [Acidobacteria bacterium]|nr:hypothetical protein [Acidobacteriota bacterium]
MAGIRRAWELDPLSLVVNTIVGWHFYTSRQYEQAIEQWQKTLEMELSFFLAHWTLWRVFRLKGRYEEALDECRKTFSLLDNREVVEATELGYAESGYGGAMRRAAQRLVAESKARYVRPTDIAMLYTHAEEKDQAIEWLEKAYEERDPWLYALGVEPDWESLRLEPRFRDLLRRLNLPEVEPRDEG